MWTLVSAPQANGAMGFQFKNVKSGEIIRVNAATNALITTTKTDDAGTKLLVMCSTSVVLLLLMHKI